MKLTSHSILFLMLLLAFFSLTGCGPSQEQIVAQTATAQTAVAALWTATPTVTTTVTSTPLPSATSTPKPSFTPTQPPSQTPTPADDSGPRTTLTSQGVTFSLVAPVGWEKAGDPDQAVLGGPTLEGTRLVLTFSIDQYNLFGKSIAADEFGIAMFSAHVQETINGMVGQSEQISEDFLETPQGVSYFRWVIEHTARGKKLHSVFYIFGSGDNFLTVMYGRPAAADAEYDPLIDAAVETIRFEE